MKTVAVDKGLLNVEFVIPASFLEGEDIATFIAEAKEDDVINSARFSRNKRTWHFFCWQAGGFIFLQ